MGILNILYNIQTSKATADGLQRMSIVTRKYKNYCKY